MEDRKIIDYVIVYDSIIAKLQKAVLEKIKEGYIPLGGVAVSNGVYSETWAQAMVKYEK